MTASLVSVVIPCHDYGRYLGEAIESALGQTHPAIEVIVVDDGSVDETVTVASRYPVRLIRQKHAGVCAAANRGIAAARGEFVLRLDADDALCPTYVEETVSALRRDPEAQFAYTEFGLFGARTGSYGIEPFDAESLAERNYIHASALMRRSAFERAGGYGLDMTGARCEEWDLWLSFADLGMRGVLVPGRLLRYRQHPSGGRNAARGLRRELLTIARLQDHHPRAFAPARLARRLLRLPGRLMGGRIPPWRAVKLVAFYGVMLIRVALGRGRRA